MEGSSVEGFGAEGAGENNLVWLWKGAAQNILRADIEVSLRKVPAQKVPVQKVPLLRSAPACRCLALAKVSQGSDAEGIGAEGSNANT